MAAATTLKPLARALLRSQPDARLVVLAREGREDAFAEIVRRYRGSLVPFAAAYCPRDQAEDVVQESFARAWRALNESDSEIHLSGWLHTIVRNRALNARRDTRVHSELDETIDGVRQPSDIVLSREELDEVVSAVRALPPTQREALVRSALEGHSHEQIASALSTSPGAVRQLIFRARHGLRESFGLLIPLPLIRMLTEATAEQAAAGGAGTAGAAAAAAGAGGASFGVKAVAVIAVGAAVAGSGIAIERGRHAKDGGEDVAAAAVGGSGSGGGTPAADNSSFTGPESAHSGSSTDSRESSGDSQAGGSEGPGGDDSRDGSDGSGSSGSGGDDQDDSSAEHDDGGHSGPGPGPTQGTAPPSGDHHGGELDGEDEPEAEHSGHSGSDDEIEPPEIDGDDHSGPEPEEPEPIEPVEDHSGDGEIPVDGDGSSGDSGSGSGDSSGSGSAYELEQRRVIFGAASG